MIESGFNEVNCKRIWCSLYFYTYWWHYIYSQCSFHLVVTRRMSSGTGTDHPSGAPEFTSGRIRFAQYLVFCSVLQIIVCRFVIFFWPLYCLPLSSIYGFWLTPLVSQVQTFLPSIKYYLFYLMYFTILRW
jgi:hypothetical protein